MSMRITVGLSRKIGQGSTGSQEGFVHLETEVGDDVASDPGKLREKVRQLLGLVRSSLAEERSGGPNQTSTLPARETASPPAATSAPATDNSGQRGAVRLATQAQVKAIYAISRKSGIVLDELLHERCRVRRPDELTLQQASTLIDELKRTAS
jgi:hypothetical protein